MRLKNKRKYRAVVSAKLDAFDIKNTELTG
jgi:hypothetical protein